VKQDAKLDGLLRRFAVTPKVNPTPHTPHPRSQPLYPKPQTQSPKPKPQTPDPFDPKHRPQTQELAENLASTKRHMPQDPFEDPDSLAVDYVPGASSSSLLLASLELSDTNVYGY